MEKNKTINFSLFHTSLNGRYTLSARAAAASRAMWPASAAQGVDFRLQDSPKAKIVTQRLKNND